MNHFLPRSFRRATFGTTDFLSAADWNLGQSPRLSFVLALCCGDNLRPPAGRLILAVEVPARFICSACRFPLLLPCHMLIAFRCDTWRPVGRRRTVTEPLCRLVKSKSSWICPRSSVILYSALVRSAGFPLFFAPSLFALVTDIPTLEVRLYWLQNVLAKPRSQGFQFALFCLLSVMSIRYNSL